MSAADQTEVREKSKLNKEIEDQGLKSSDKSFTDCEFAFLAVASAPELNRLILYIKAVCSTNS